MIVLFRDQSCAGHEAEGFVEILEDEGLGDGLAALHLRPAGQACQGRFPCFYGEPLRHLDLHLQPNFTLTSVIAVTMTQM